MRARIAWLLVFAFLTPLRAQNRETLAEARTLMQQGRYQQAGLLLESATGADGLRLLIELSQRRGERQRADSCARRILQLHNRGELVTAEQLGHAAFAAWQLDLWHDANRLFMESAGLQPSLSVSVDWGDLYLEKYNPAEAESIFREATALVASPHPQRWTQADAYAGLAAALQGQFKPGVSQALDRALEIDADNLRAITLKALLALQGHNWKEAATWINRGQEINPAYLPLLELSAARFFLRGEKERYRKTLDRILEINPSNGDVFETLGDLSVLSRRLEDAVEHYREAVQRNPRQWSALASLGINLLRMGGEEEGKRTLERAYARDPFNIWTVNTLRLLDSFDRFVRFETEHFRVRLEKTEEPALRPYVEDLLERSLLTLEHKYNHQVTGRYVFEMYPDHDDFAVRTLGLPGLGALGATFGRVVAMDSPAARPRGEFHWGSTLWHEVAHVVTLSLSGQKVPRWLTEGISMMEERQAGDGWGDYLDAGFIRAWEDEQLLPLDELDSGFLRPRNPQQVTLSYFQAGWLCEFLVSRYGFDKLRAMLVAFAEDQSMEEVFEKVLDASVEEVDRQFRAELERIMAPLAPFVESVTDGEAQREPGRPRGIEMSVEALRRLLAANPDNYFLNLALGRSLVREEQFEEAVPYLERALEMLPAMAGRGSPYPPLVAAYDKTGQQGKALQLRLKWWKASPLFMENALELAQLLSGRGQPAEASEILEEAMFLDPLSPEPHQTLGELYLDLQQPRQAVREFAVLLNMNPVDSAGAHYRLARALYESGDKEQARRQVVLSLEIAPSYREAQELLLRLVSP